MTGSLEDDPDWLVEDIRNMKKVSNDVQVPVKPLSIISSNAHSHRRPARQTVAHSAEDMKVYNNFCKVAEDRNASVPKRENIISTLQLSPRPPGGSNEGKFQRNSQVIDEVFTLMNKNKRAKKEKRERLYRLVISRIKAVAAHPPVGKTRMSFTSHNSGEGGLVPSEVLTEEPHIATDEYSSLNASNLKLEVEEVRRKLVVAITALSFFVSAKHALREKQRMIEMSLLRIGRVFSAHRRRRKVRAMTNLIWPIKFIVAIKIAKKSNAAAVIKYFINFSVKKKYSMLYVVRTYFSRIKLVQRVIRTYLQHRRYRKEMILLYWDKIEKRCRHVFEEREKRRLETQRVLIAKRLANQKGHNNIHVRWHKVHSKVQSLMHQINIVTFDCMQTTQGGQHFNDDMVVTNKILAKKEFKSYFSYNHRMDIILKHILSKYRIHRARIEEKKQELISASTVDVKHAMILLSNPKNLSAEDKGVILESQLAASIDTERISGQIRGLNSTPMLYLTGSLGVSWKHIIEEVVKDNIRAISNPK